MQTEVLTYLKKHWFKITLVAVLVFVGLKKDLSFRINVQTPVRPGRPVPEEPAPTQSVKEEQKRETYTENLDQPLEARNSSVIDQFRLSPLGSSSENKMNAYDRVRALEEAAVKAYIERFSRVAVMEQEKYGIPASIIVGNALLCSRAGSSEMPREGNNHFALKCTSDWQGETGRYDAQCFRHYENAWTSFRDHSLYLTTGEMGQRLSGLSGKSFKEWARALEKAAFSDEKDYGRQLIRLIQEHQLDRFDR